MVTWPICSSCCNTLTHITVPTDQANQYSLIYIAIKESVRHTTPHHIAGELDFRSLYMYNKINDNNSITERIHTFWTIATIYRSVLFCLVSGCFWFFSFSFGFQSKFLFLSHFRIRSNGIFCWCRDVHQIAQHCYTLSMNYFHVFGIICCFSLYYLFIVLAMKIALIINSFGDGQILLQLIIERVLFKSTNCNDSNEKQKQQTARHRGTHSFWLHFNRFK